MTEPANSGGASAVVDPSTGQVVEADDVNLSKLLDSGYRLASPEEVQAERDRQEYGEGFANEAAAFGEGALSGATLGLSDVAAKAISDDYARELALRREYNPTAAGIGEGAGVLGATLLSGGLGGAAAGTAGAARGGSLLARGGGALLRGAELATAPARALVGLGEAAAAGTGRLLGAEAATSILGGAARQGLALATGGAVEGALFGAAKAATDDYLHDHEITAERVAMGGGMGALLGGGVGGALGLAGGLAGGVARKARDLFSRTDAEQGATRALEEGLGADARLGAGAEAEAAGATLTADQKILQQIGYKSDDQVMAELTLPTNPERTTAMERVRGLAEQADAAKRFQALKQETTGSIVGDIEEFRRIEDELETYINRGHKRNAVKAQLEVAPPDWTPDNVDRVLGAVDESRTRLSKMREDTYALDNTQHAAIKDAVDMANELEARIKGFSGRKVKPQAGPLSPDAPAVRADADAIADIHDLHDKFKGALGRAARKAGNASPSHINAAEAALRREYMGHRGLLEDELLYGKGATELQRITNAAESEAILYSKAWDDQFGLAEGRQTKRAGVDEAGRTFDTVQTFDKLNEASHPKIRNMLETVGDDPQMERTFVLGLQRQADKLKTKADFYAMPPEIRAKALRAKELADKAVASMRDVKATRQMADEYATAVNELRDIPIYGEQLAKLKIAFGRSANLVANTGVESSVAATGGRARARSAAQSAVRAGIAGERAVEGAGKGVVRWLREAGKATARAAERTAKGAREVAKAGPLLGVSLATDSPASAERLIRNITALRDPQSDERRTARVQSLELKQTNPGLAAALENQTQRVADFLAQKAGDLSVGPRPGDPFGQARKPRHSPASVAKLGRYAEAATNPRGVLERIGTGQIGREDVEVLQTLYPRLYRRVRDEVLQNLSSVDELPSYDARLKLGILLGAPADPSMRPAMVQALQQVARGGAGANPEQQAQQGMPPGAPPQSQGVGEPVLSPSQRREPKLGPMYATQTQAQSVEGSRQGG